MANLETSTGIQDHRVVSREEWIAARKELLGKEKQFTVSADVTYTTVCGVADLPCSKARTPSNRVHIPWKRNGTFSVKEAAQ